MSEFVSFWIKSGLTWNHADDVEFHDQQPIAPIDRVVMVENSEGGFDEVSSWKCVTIEQWEASPAYGSGSCVADDTTFDRVAFYRQHPELIGLLNPKFDDDDEPTDDDAFGNLADYRYENAKDK